MDQSMPVRRGRPPGSSSYRKAQALVLAGTLASAWPKPVPVAANCRECGESLRRQRGRDVCAICAHPFDLIDYRNCAACRVLFVGRAGDGGHRKTCGPPCAAVHRNRLAAARKRQREHARRTALSDITTDQEMEMRRRARRCAMCRVALADEDGQPNSKHLDHIVPLGVGGTHTHGNVRITCRTCNVRRPRDGSDYTGPVTLWAVIPGVAARPDRRVAKA